MRFVRGHTRDYIRPWRAPWPVPPKPSEGRNDVVQDIDDVPRLARKITRVLFLAQSLSSAGFIAGATVSSIVGAELSGSKALAGVPSTVFLLVGALSAPGWGYGMDRLGRRGSLTLGLMLGVAGGIIAVVAIFRGSFGMLLVGMTMMGASNAAMQLARFAAAEVHPIERRGRAISNVVIGGTVGAVLGPLLVGPSGSWAVQAGIDELAGPFAAGVGLLLAASLFVFGGLRPDPKELGKRLVQETRVDSASLDTARPVAVIFRQPAAALAVLSMVIGQMVMVMLMVITSLFMRDHDHPLSAISFVISSHTFGMYAFSIVSGRLSDRLGRGPVIAIGAGTLLIASALARLSPEVTPLAIALFLLGLGWNFCFVGGSSLLADQLAPQERARTQGINDLLIGMGSGAGSLGSGIVFASIGYRTMGLVGAAASLALLLAAFIWLRGQPHAAESV